MNEWTYLLVGIALTSGVFALLLVLFTRLRQGQQGYPLEAQIEAALLPFIYEAICAAYRLSEQAVDEGIERIRGLDKKAIADSAYAMLPDQIGDYSLVLVKQLIPQERFVTLVQNAFDAFDRFYLEHKGHFDDQFEEWKKEHAPSG